MSARQARRHVWPDGLTQARHQLERRRHHVAAFQVILTAGDILDRSQVVGKSRVIPLDDLVEQCLFGSVALGKEIYAAGQEVQFVYFPVDCIISLLYLMIDGHSAEISGANSTTMRPCAC